MFVWGQKEIHQWDAAYAQPSGAQTSGRQTGLAAGEIKENHQSQQQTTTGATCKCEESFAEEWFLKEHITSSTLCYSS